MPTPVTPKVIKITVTSGAKGQPIIVRNRSTGEVINTTLGDAAKAVVDLQNFASGYTAGQAIDLIVSGEQIGGNTLTPSGTEPESITVSTTAITSSLTRGI